MMSETVIKALFPDPDGQFRLMPCKVCGCREVAYILHRDDGEDAWRVQCPDCGHSVGKHTAIRHEAQLVWNQEVSP